VCIPAPTAAGGRPTGEVVPSDLWAWRKYGQKPIKGSPYPRHVLIRHASTNYLGLRFKGNINLKLNKQTAGDKLEVKQAYELLARVNKTIFSVAHSYRILCSTILSVCVA
jgi:hypothetical protein